MSVHVPMDKRRYRSASLKCECTSDSIIGSLIKHIHDCANCKFKC